AAAFRRRGRRAGAMKHGPLAGVVLGAALWAAPARATDPDVAARIQHGIEAVYKMEFDECERTFRQLLKDYPGHPYGYFGLAAAYWSRFEYEQEESDLSLHEAFEKSIDDGVARGQEWLKAHPGDSDAFVCVSAMYGLRSRLSMMLHRWIRAYLDGTKALKLIHRAVELDPKQYDANTGLGMWDYYTDTLPGVVKVLGRIVSIRGDAPRGIARLKLAAEKGRFTSTTAKLILVELYQDRHTPYFNPKEGLRMIREIRKGYPMNPLFHFVELIYLYEGGQGPEAVRSAEDMLKGIHEGRRFYHPRYAPRAYAGLGTAHFLAKDWAKAAAAFGEGAKVLLEKPGRHNRWGLYSLIRRGQVRDVQGDRAGAVEDYK
ncbi:MAG: hypothetical protein FD126_3467, partial [Elusimicrobia bacterium]